MVFDKGMKTLYAREITAEEHAKIEQGLRSSSAFTVRRGQILLMSADEHRKPREIAERLKCSDQCVRDAIRAVRLEGVQCLQTKSRARHTEQATFNQAGLDWLKAAIRQSPQTFGYETSLWTLKLLSELAHKEGYSDRVVRPETVGRALVKAGIRWNRAKQWINSPDEHYQRKKSDVTA